MTVIEEAPPLSRAELFSFLDDYDPRFLECRGWGHAWMPSRGRRNKRYDHNAKLNVLEKPVPCLRCGTIRWERRIKVNGRWIEPPVEDLVGAPYTYPDGYLFPPGVIITRFDVREYMAWKDGLDG